MNILIRILRLILGISFELLFINILLNSLNFQFKLLLTCCEWLIAFSSIGLLLFVLLIIAFFNLNFWITFNSTLLYLRILMFLESFHSILVESINYIPVEILLILLIHKFLTEFIIVIITIILLFSIVLIIIIFLLINFKFLCIFFIHKLIYIIIF